MPGSRDVTPRRRGPRGDLGRDTIRAAAHDLLERHGSPSAVSLRMLAGEVGVAPNALYTYFADVNAVWHDVADATLRELDSEELRSWDCRHCALVELVRRCRVIWARPWVIPLMNHQPALGSASFALSETTMTLCEHASVTARDAHDLLHGWFFGSTALAAAGWERETDEIRALGEGGGQFPLVFARTDADHDAQLKALLRGIDVRCTCARPAEPTQPTRPLEPADPTGPAA